MKHYSPEEFILQTLKKRYFDIALKEDYPKTPLVTVELDKLEAAIRRATRDLETQHGGA